MDSCVIIHGWCLLPKLIFQSIGIIAPGCILTDNAILHRFFIKVSCVLGIKPMVCFCTGLASGLYSYKQLQRGRRDSRRQSADCQRPRLVVTWYVDPVDLEYHCDFWSHQPATFLKCGVPLRYAIHRYYNSVSKNQVPDSTSSELSAWPGGSRWFWRPAIIRWYILVCLQMKNKM